MNRGFYLSLEACVSLILLIIAILAVAGVDPDTNLKEIYILQKENDLLKIWSRKCTFSESEIISDFNFAFPESCGKIEVDGIIISNNNCAGNSISSSAYFFDADLNPRKITLTVFY